MVEKPGRQEFLQTRYQSGEMLCRLDTLQGRHQVGKPIGGQTTRQTRLFTSNTVQKPPVVTSTRLYKLRVDAKSKHILK